MSVPTPPLRHRPTEPVKGETTVGTSAIVTLILQAIQAVMQAIAEVRSTSSLTDDQKAAATQQLLQANDVLYSSLKQALTTGQPVTAVSPAPTA